MQDVQSLEYRLFQNLVDVEEQMVVLFSVKNHCLYHFQHRKMNLMVEGVYLYLIA